MRFVVVDTCTQGSAGRRTLRLLYIVIVDYLFGLTAVTHWSSHENVAQVNVKLYAFSTAADVMNENGISCSAPRS